MGEFTLGGTRRNIINNVSAQDFQRVTGQPYSTLSGMSDRALATSFTQYWSAKYAAIGIADRGIQATGPAQPGRERAAPLADGVLERGERGDEVRALQASLNQLGFRDRQDEELETGSGIYGPRTIEAVRAFQAANNLETTGAADQRTHEAIAQQLGVPEQQRNRPQPAGARQGDGTFWPTPGNYDINQADKPREGRGEFGTLRSSGHPHGGVDIQGNVGDPVVAFAGGTVVVRPNNGNAGNTVHVRHDDGTLTKYFHLDQFSVRNNQRVEAGEQVGTMGRTGNTPARGDTHLHFELWRNNRQVDPMPYLQTSGRDVVGETAPSPRNAAVVGVLRNGASGPAVSELQQQLNRLGYTGTDGRPLEIASGRFGPHTEHALRAFQNDRSVNVDGVHGNESRGALAAALREQDVRRDGGAVSVVLRQDSRGADVGGLQSTLNRLGYTDANGRRLAEDSLFGDRTRQAVMRFQRDHALEEDGIAGPRTLTRLGEVVPRSPTERVDVEARVNQPEGGNRPAEVQHSFVDRMVSAMHAGDDRAMRQALDEYLKTPAGQGWQRQAEAAVNEPQLEQQRDSSGQSR